MSLVDLDWCEDDAMPRVSSSSYSDNWTSFFLGIIIGMSGGGLLSVSVWLGSTLIAIGYGWTYSGLARARNSFTRALAFGFAMASLIGALIFAWDMTWPRSAERFSSVLGLTHLLFLAVFVLPWALAFLRLITKPSQKPPRILASKR